MQTDKKTPKRIGIYGGSFDPIHLGHLTLAKVARAELLLDHIIFVPTKKQPFKLDKTPASAEDRVNMINLAIKNEDNFSISLLEIERDGISYTIDTVRNIKDIYGKNNIYYLIMGADTFLNLERWYMADEILSFCNLAVGVRPGTSVEKLEDTRVRINKTYDTKIVFLNNKELEISSTDIKESLKNNVQVAKLLPDEVANYINEKRLYR